MKTYSLFVAAFILLLPGSASAQKDELKKQLVGKWEATLQDAAKVDFKILTEFKADGKMEVDVKGIKLPGTWKLDGDKTIVTETVLPDGSKKTAKQEATIANDELQLKDATGQIFRFKRIK